MKKTVLALSYRSCAGTGVAVQYPYLFPQTGESRSRCTGGSE
ncbi:MAG: hypothetical protein OEV74_06055 [Cyclobacteriaceae bacterium]|nr:hypothetical protein [Cyclobacteriaceae bacterium]MDH4295822.1 hypothetical protein [Cyclobacteriaceae bacterium]MDH5248436.1 hypothetical protein [Cyclobacteriaceae bacterium]